MLQRTLVIRGIFEGSRVNFYSESQQKSANGRRAAPRTLGRFQTKNRQIPAPGAICPVADRL